MLNSRAYAVIAGVGPGTGAAIARKVAQTYPVVLLARSADTLSSVSKQITDAGGQAIGLEADLTNGESVQKAFRAVDEKFGQDAPCAVAIFNAAARPAWKPFLELDEKEFTLPYTVSCQGGFHFAQATLPRLLKKGGLEKPPQYPPTLIFTGATAAMKGSALLAPFAAGKSALRTLTQSLAREFNPKGVHVCHVIIDGLIDTAMTADFMKDQGPDAKISPETIADTYWYLHTQPRSGFTHELEIRPAAEKW